MNVIEYAPKTAVTKRRVIVAVLFILVAGMTVLLRAYGLELYRWSTFKYVEYRCRHYQVPSNTSPSTQPSCLAQYLTLCGTGIPSNNAVYLMHELSSKAGTPHLWIAVGNIQIDEKSGKGRRWNQFNLYTYGFPVGRRGEEDAGGGIEVQLGYAQHAAVFGAKLDPANLSHFEMVYELDGARGTIDYWVTEDPIHEIQFKVRDGPALPWQ